MYDAIVLKPFYSLIVKEKDLDNHAIIKTNAKPLSNIVVVRINGFCYKFGDQIIEVDPDIIYQDNFNDYVVVLDDFITLLEQRGFEYTGFKPLLKYKNK